MSSHRHAADAPPVSTASACATFLTGPVASIALHLLIVVVVVGLTWVGPTLPLGRATSRSSAPSSRCRCSSAAFAGFALLAGVVDLSIGSMVGFSSAIFGDADGDGLAALARRCRRRSPPACSSASINAVAVVGFGADAIAATLGMLVALRGISFIITGAARLGHRLRRRPLRLHQLPPSGRCRSSSSYRARPDRHRRDHRRQDAVRAARPGGRRRRASRRLAPASRSRGVRFAALLLSALRRRHRRHRLCRPARQRRPSYTGIGLEFQVYAAMMIGGYSILRGGVGNPDRRRARPAGRRRDGQHPRSAGDQSRTTSTSSSGCCCSRRSCSTASAAATPTNEDRRGN